MLSQLIIALMPRSLISLRPTDVIISNLGVTIIRLGRYLTLKKFFSSLQIININVLT